MTGTAAWSGGVGGTWADEWRRTDRSFAGLSPALDAAILAAAPDEDGLAIDLGCGAGQTAIALATALSDLQVVGVDVSAELVDVAAGRARSLSNLRFHVADVARDTNAIAAGSNLLFSRHGVMFFDDPATVFAGLRRAVAPGARLVFSCFRDRSANPWASDLVAAVTGDPTPPPVGYAPGPFGFADADWVASLLASAGWQDAASQPVNYEYVAGEGADPVADAVAFFGLIGPVASAIAAASGAQQVAMRHRLAAALEPWHQGDRVSFPAAAWIWSARA